MEPLLSKSLELTIDDFIFIANGHVSALINKLLNRAFKIEQLNLTTEQWTILCSLWGEDGQTQQSLGARTYKEKASITRLLDTLERNGYISRHSDPSDRRTNLVRLTDEGRLLEERANAIVLNFVHRVIGGIDIESLKKMKEQFLRMYGNLS